MGGSGSGRHSGYDAKRTVDDGLVLKVEKIARDKMIREIPRWASLTWSRVSTGEQTASAGYKCVRNGDAWIVTLSYTVTRRDGTKHSIEEPIGLQATYPRFGGVRWWFTCPLEKNGVACRRRVGRLYLPPGALYFGCRHCYDLTYTSCQESHKYDRLWRRLAADTGASPEFVKQVMERRYGRG